MPKHLVLILSLIAAIVLLLMLNFTTPAGVGPLGVLVFFSACYILVFGINVMLVKILTKLAGKQMGRRGYLYAAVFAFGPIMTLLVESLGTLNPFTLVLIIALILLVCFLISKSR